VARDAGREPAAVVPVVPVVPAVAVAGGVAAVVPAVVPPVVPAVDAVLELDAPPIIAFARMKLLLEVALVLLADPSCRHPVTVTVLSSVVLLLVVVLGVCAAAVIVVAHASATAIHTLRFIIPPWPARRASSIPEATITWMRRQASGKRARSVIKSA